LVGVDWEFEQLEGRSRARMFINQSATDLRNESTWADVYQWLGEKLSLVYERVAPKLRDDLDGNKPA
jgi:hypothetical protein